MQQLGVTYFNETKKGPGHARQCGLNQAKGKYHICIDTDTIYPSRYIKTHVKQLMKPGVACTFSLWSFIPDERHSATGLWWYEALRDLHLRIQSIQRPELCVRGMTFGFNTELGRKFGFPDRYYPGRGRVTGFGNEALWKIGLYPFRKSQGHDRIWHSK